MGDVHTDAVDLHVIAGGGETERLLQCGKFSLGKW